MKWARLNFGSFMFPRPPPGTITNEQWTGYQGGGRAAEACSGAEGRPDKPPRLHGAPVSRSALPSRGAAAAGSGLPAAESVPCPGRCAVAAQDQRTVGLLSRPRGRVMCRTPYCVLGRIFLQFPCFPVGSTCRGWLVIHLTQRPTENTAHCP